VQVRARNPMSQYGPTKWPSRVLPDPRLRINKDTTPEATMRAVHSGLSHASMQLSMREDGQTCVSCLAGWHSVVNEYEYPKERKKRVRVCWWLLWVVENSCRVGGTLFLLI